MSNIRERMTKYIVCLFILLTLLLGGGRYSIDVPIESNGAVPINIQDQTSRALDLKFLLSQGQDTLSVQADPEDTTITLTDSTGFVDGNVIGIFCPCGDFFFGTQIGAPSGNIVTLDTPIDVIYEVGSNVIRATDNMAVDGSLTTQVFQIGPVGATAETEVDITRLMGYLEDATAMDEAKFGGITALTNGIVLRVNDTVITNIWNIKSNGDFGLICFDTEYTTKAPAGVFGFRFRNTYAGQDKHGVTIRLYPGDKLELLVQDDLTDLLQFNMMAQGHVVTD